MKDGILIIIFLNCLMLLCLVGITSRKMIFYIGFGRHFTSTDVDADDIESLWQTTSIMQPTYVLTSIENRNWHHKPK